MILATNTQHAARCSDTLLFKVKEGVSSAVGTLLDLDRVISVKSHRYILAYHRVIPESVTHASYIHDSMWVTPQTFEVQIRWMLKVGQIVDIRRLLNFKETHSKPLFSISFDDGWKDTYDYAFPILKQYRVPATVFLVTSAVTTGHLFWPEEVLQKTQTCVRQGSVAVGLLAGYLGACCQVRAFQRRRIWILVDRYLEYLKTLSPKGRKDAIRDYYRFLRVDASPVLGEVLNWEEVLEMRKSGFSFGSHTHSHEILSICDDETVLDELSTSKSILEDRLQTSIGMFCYPNANYSSSHASLIEKAGYELAFTTANTRVREGYAKHFIPRVSVNEQIYRNSNYFKFKLIGMPRY